MMYFHLPGFVAAPTYELNVVSIVDEGMWMDTSGRALLTKYKVQITRVWFHIVPNAEIAQEKIAIFVAALA